MIPQDQIDGNERCQTNNLGKGFRGEERLRHEVFSPPAILDQPMGAAESRIVKTDPAFVLTL